MTLAIDFESGFQDAFDEGIALLPKLGYFLLILLVGILVAKLVAGILTKVLRKVGFDRLVERGGVKQALARSKYDAAGLLSKIVYYAIFLVVLSLAFNVFGRNPISEGIGSIVGYLPKLFAAIVILVIAAAIAAAVKEIINSVTGAISFGNLLATAASVFVLGIGVFAALDQLEIAPDIVRILFVAVLALVVIPLIISFGIGGIDPARQLIQQAVGKSQQKADQAQAEVQAARAAQSAQAAPAKRAPARRGTRTTTTL